MADWLQWGITAIVAILSFLAGRYWNLKDRRIAKDEETYKEFQELLTPNTMQYVMENDFGGAISNHEFSKWSRFCERCKHPDFSFLDKDLESSKIDLYNKMDHFTQRVAILSFPINKPGIEYNQIPRPSNNPEQFQTIKKELNDLANDVYSSYENLVQKANKILI